LSSYLVSGYIFDQDKLVSNSERLMIAKTELLLHRFLIATRQVESQLTRPVKLHISIEQESDILDS